MDSLESRRKAFSEIAEHYDRFRPGYPAEVVDDVVLLSGLPPGGRILEVGCGSGHATALFAPRGYSITALEPAPGMAAVTRRRLRDAANVRVIETTLEAWDSGGEQFDVVLAASSIHLVVAEHRLTKPARLLRPGGSIAAVWHDRVPGTTELHQQVADAFEAHAPSMEQANYLGGVPFEDLLDDSGLYRGVYMRRYRWRRNYEAQEYLDFLDSFSTHRLLAPGEHAALHDAIGRLIRQAGGHIDQDFVTRVWVAKLR